VTTSTPTAPSRAGDPALARDPQPGPSGGGDPPSSAVVVGVDGGDCALAAVRWAAEEAGRRGAPLRIVHAAPYIGRRLEPGAVSPELHRARRITAQAYTRARHAAAGVRATTEVVPGQPGRVLVDEAATAQLVVLGIATTGAVDELVVAPVAQRVAARSRTPVVVVPRPRGAVPAERPVAAILGLGDPDDDEPVVRWAADHARRTGTSLTVLRPRRGRPSGLPPVDWAGQHPDLRVAVRDVPGVDPRELLRAVCPAPVVVLGAGHGSFLHRLLDGPHRFLLRHCTSPLAMIPPVHRPQDEPHEEILALG
jgi:nucleotide-binding universal stress UspA family protein